MDVILEKHSKQKFIAEECRRNQVFRETKITQLEIIINEKINEETKGDEKVAEHKYEFKVENLKTAWEVTTKDHRCGSKN